MNKFIGVSLTLLMVASLASAEAIESPVAHMGEFDPKLFNFEGFASGAIVTPWSGNVRHKTPTFPASDAEINIICSNLDTFAYFEDNVLVQGSTVVLGGVTYKLVEADTHNLVAENGKTGVVAREIQRGDWVIGVYDENITREQAEKKIRAATLKLSPFGRPYQ